MSENGDLIEAVERLAVPKEIPIGDENFAVAIPGGFQLESIKGLLDEYRAHPEHTEGIAVLESRESFVSYVNRFKRDESVIFASERGAGGYHPYMIAVIDHHVAGERAGRCRHRANYHFPLSDEWLAWAALDGTTLDQRAFAEAVEDRILDVIDPDGTQLADRFARDLGLPALTDAAGLRDLARGLRVRVKLEAHEHLDLQSGAASLTFSEGHEDAKGGALVVPGGFVIAIPVVRCGPRYPMCVRLRYRINGGRVSWSFLLHRADLVLRDAFTEACSLTAAETGLEVLLGHPETSWPTDDDD